MAEEVCDYPGVKRRFVRANGIDFLVEEEGKGTPLVVIHGGPGADHRYFHPHLSRLASFCRVILYDLRGQGASSEAEFEDDYGLFQDSEDLEALRKKLGLKHFHVLGHSYGALVALEYTQVHNEHVLSVILCSLPVGIGQTEEEAEARSAEVWRRLREQFPQETDEELYYRFYYHKPPDPQTRRYADLVLRNFSSPKIRRVLKGYAEDEYESFARVGLLTIQSPIYLLYGRYDPLCKYDKLRPLVERNPLMDLTVFEESAHDPFADEPEKFAELLSDMVVPP